MNARLLQDGQAALPWWRGPLEQMGAGCGMVRASDGEIRSGVGLALDARDHLTAAVFDANCFGRGRPDVDQLGYHAQRLAEIGIETWVPEPVAWEWAEHLAQDWNTLRVGLAEGDKRLRKAGLSGYTTPYPNAAAVAEAFLAQLGSIPHVVVVPLGAANARHGLRDQILQLPPGRRKEGVKTGASDSAWLREILERVGQDVMRVLFISTDHDLRTALLAWDLPEPLMRPLKDLHATLFTVSVDTGSATRVLLHHLLDVLPTPPGTGLLELGATPGLRAALEPLFFESGPDPRVESASLSRITGLAGIGAVTVEAPPDENTPDGNRGPARDRYNQADHKSPHTVMATAWLLAEADVTVDLGYGDDPRRVRVETVSDVLLRIRLIFDLEAGRVVAMRPQGEADVFAPVDRFDNDEDTFAELSQMAGCVPGLGFLDGWPFQDAPELEEEVNGRTVRCTFTHHDIGQWSTVMEVDDLAVELSCVYNTELLPPSWRSDGSAYYRQAHCVTLAGTESTNPIWALAGWLTAHLYS